MADNNQNDIATVGGLAVLATVLSVVAIVVGITRSGSTAEGITGHDLRLAIIECEPFDATFEQTLACYQAVYGNAAK